MNMQLFNILLALCLMYIVQCDEMLFPKLMQWEEKPYVSNSVVNSEVTKILNGMSLEQKVGQMTQLDIAIFLKEGTYEINEENTLNLFKNYHVGSILNTPFAGGCYGDKCGFTTEEWVAFTGQLQRLAKQAGLDVPIIYGIDSVHGANYVFDATMFPQQIGAAASFNRSVSFSMGEINGRQTRNAGMQWAFSPILGLATSPAWPRVYETFGEDPYLVGEMGANIIKGMQGKSGSNGGKFGPTNVAACMKHFFGYSNPRNGQDVTPNWTPETMLLTYYMKPFRAAVNAGVRTAMESYNELNGRAIVGSKKWLNTYLRDKLGFTGLLVTDYEEIDKLWWQHKAAPSKRAAIAQAIRDTSIDMSMVPFNTEFCDHLIYLVKNGYIDESRLDESVTRALQLKYDLNILHDAPSPALVLPTAADRAAALDASRQAVVLLKNTDDILPVNATSGQKVAIIGPGAETLSGLVGGWSVHWTGPLKEESVTGTTVKQGMENLLSSKGVTITTNNGTNIEAAKAVASDADHVIVVLAEGHYAEIFGNINDLALEKAQQDLVLGIAETGKKIILVLIEGRMRLLSKEVMEATDAFLLGLFPGPDGGQAIADIITGEYNPSARMPLTYGGSPVGSAPYWRSAMPSENNDLFSFADGLSYTKFAHGEMKIGETDIPQGQDLMIKIKPGDELEFSVAVTNIGDVSGAESVLMWLQDEYRIVTPEAKILKGFEKVYLEPYQKTRVTFKLTTDDLMFYDEETPLIEAGDFKLQIGEVFVRLNLDWDEKNGDDVNPTKPIRDKIIAGIIIVSISLLVAGLIIFAACNRRNNRDGGIRRIESRGSHISGLQRVASSLGIKRVASRLHYRMEDDEEDGVQLHKSVSSDKTHTLAAGGASGVSASDSTC